MIFKTLRPALARLLGPTGLNIHRGWKSNPRPPDHKSNALTTKPRCSTVVVAVVAAVVVVGLVLIVIVVVLVVEA
ncbi:hypothetical protein ElyMa_000807100, partial [Elysia marginata]